MAAYFMGLIPFWIWISLGIVIGWKLRGFFGSKFAFLNKVRHPFRKKASSSDKRGEEKKKGVVRRVTGWLAGPIERWMGDDKKGNKK